MRKVIGAVLAAGSLATACLGAQELKVLMIGNSFSVCVGSNLPQIVKSVPEKRIELTSAYIGGCSLERHWNNIEKAEQDPEFKPYEIKEWDSNDLRKQAKRKGNVNELLKNNQYDIITIQQASPLSWDADSYQPFADQLIAYLKKQAPNAEIIVQQTWAYRSDDGRIHPQKHSWPFDQAGMHDRLTAAYQKLAAQHGFRVIPMGDAVQLSREQSPVKYNPPTPEELAALSWPDLPRQAGDVVGRNNWWKDSKTGELKIGGDTIHLNVRGEYLQACVWFAFLFDTPTSEIRYDNPQMSAADCEFLRRCAQQAVDRFPQVSKKTK